MCGVLSAPGVRSPLRGFEKYSLSSDTRESGLAPRGSL